MKDRRAPELGPSPGRIARQQVSGPVAIIVIAVATIVLVAIFGRASLAPEEAGPFILPFEPELSQDEMVRYLRGLRPLGVIPVMPPLVSDRMKGVRVAGLAIGRPAQRAGIQPADLIVGFDGKPVAHAPGLISLVRRAEGGKSHVVAIMRAGKKMSLTVTGILPAPPGERPRPEGWPRGGDAG